MPVKCEVCGLDYSDQFFSKIEHRDLSTEPAYLATPYFNKELDKIIFFCSPKHSLEWYTTTKRE